MWGWTAGTWEVNTAPIHPYSDAACPSIPFSAPRLACSICRRSPRGRLTLYRRAEVDGVRDSVTNADRVRGREDKMRSCLGAGRQGSCKTEEKRNWYIAREEWADRPPPLVVSDANILDPDGGEDHCLCREERSNRPIVLRPTLQRENLLYTEIYFIKIWSRK